MKIIIVNGNPKYKLEIIRIPYNIFNIKGEVIATKYEELKIYYEITE